VTARDPWDELAAEAQRLFGLVLSPSDVGRLRAHVELLAQWSARMNLIGPASTRELVERHVLDSLAIAPLVKRATAVADFGSGAGFPAVPAAIVCPAARFDLIESRRKRCSFLRHVARTLHLPNVTVSESRGEDWNPAATPDVVTSRALGAYTLAPIASRVLGAGGRLLLMRKESGRDADALERFVNTETRRYRLPGGERHEIAVYRRL
jgi:16S rRNA (guanine527-N7)-methyltransferase